MKRQFFAILGAGLLAFTVCAEDQKAAPPPSQIPAQKPAAQAEVKTDFSKIFKNDKEKISYAIGMWASANLKGMLKRDELEIDQEALTKAFKDSMADAPTLITESQKMEILKALTMDLQAKKAEKQKEMAEKQKAMGEKNKKDGEAFLAANKTKPGVKTFDSGLQYQVVTEGTGAIPKASDSVTVKYRGTLIDGTEFDSSASKPQGVTFPVTGVIPGWTEALEHMKAGSKWKLFIPSSLAYGERAQGLKIGPNSVLIFDVELLSVSPGGAPTTAALKPFTGPAISPAAHAPAQPLTSDIVKVPSAEELKKGAQIEHIKPEDIEKEKAKSSN